MSHFPSTHLVTAFDSAKSQPLTGQRLAKIRYKTTKAQTAKFPSVCVSVPFATSAIVTTDNNLDRLMPHILALIETAQDGVIRSLYEASEGKLSSVQDSELGIDSILGYLEAESQGTRLTKEFIGAWFDTDVAEILQAAFVDKWSWDGELTHEQTVKLEQVTKAHKEMFAALAGGKTSYNIGQCAGLLKVLDLADTSDTAEKLRARLVGMSTKVDIAEML
jgi:hypothetical protein